MPSKIFFLTAAITFTCISWAESADTPENTEFIERTNVQWGISAGLNTYQEPDLIQLKGPEIGLHSRITDWHVMPTIQFEADFLLGKQRYTSTNSGSLNGITNIETRWRALTPIFSSTSVTAGFSSGLAIHTLWNDLRGQTTIGANGYERSAIQLWLPLRWDSGDIWTLDVGLLLYGRHNSKLSQVSSRYGDIVNTQRRGQYAQINLTLPTNNGPWIPFIRYTHLADSDQVLGRSPIGPRYWVEPESHRWQIGVIKTFN